jgi:hypothetical protein
MAYRSTVAHGDLLIFIDKYLCSQAEAAMSRFQAAISQ